jgi:hypothetical protein
LKGISSFRFPHSPKIFIMENSEGVLIVAFPLGVFLVACVTIQ